MWRRRFTAAGPLKLEVNEVARNFAVEKRHSDDQRHDQRALSQRPARRVARALINSARVEHGVRDQRRSVEQDQAEELTGCHPLAAAVVAWQKREIAQELVHV